MATKEEILAKVTAQKGVLDSVALAVDELNGDMASISEKIDAMQKQIDDGVTPDLSELDAEVDKVTGVIAGLMPAIKTNPNP